MATRYWVGGNGTWDGSNTTRWASVSGGATGASAPTLADDVIFDSNSKTAGSNANVTILNTANCFNLTVYSNVTANLNFIGNGAMQIAGNLFYPAANVNETYTGTRSFVSNVPGVERTIITNGTPFNSQSTYFSGNSIFKFGSAITLGNNGDVYHNNGVIVTDGYTYTTRYHYFSSNVAKTVDFSNSTIYAYSIQQGSTTTGNNTYLKGSNSTIFISGVFSVAQATSGLSNIKSDVLPNIIFNGGGVIDCEGSFVDNILLGNITVNLSGNNPSIYNLSLYSNLKVLNKLTFSGYTKGARLAVEGVTTPLGFFYVSQRRTINVNSISSLTDIDFGNINVIGVTAPWSGTRLGNLIPNSNIITAAGTKKYWSLYDGGNILSNAWALTSGGTPDENNFPLFQDTIIIDDVGLKDNGVIDFYKEYPSGMCFLPEFDASARSNSFTLNLANIYVVFTGNINLKSNTTVTGTNFGTLMLDNGSFLHSKSARNNYYFFDYANIATQLYTGKQTGDLIFLSNVRAASFNLDFGAANLNLNGYDLNLTSGYINLNSISNYIIKFNNGSINLLGNTSFFNITWLNAFSYTGNSNININYTGNFPDTHLLNFFSGTITEAKSLNFTVSGNSNINMSGISGATPIRDFNLTNLTGTLINRTRTVYGNLIIGANSTVQAGANATTLAGTRTNNIIQTNGKTLDFPLTITAGGDNAEWDLVGNLTLGSTRTLTLNRGNLNLNGSNLTTGLFASTSSTVRRIIYKTGGESEKISITGNNGTVMNIGTSSTLTYRYDSGKPPRDHYIDYTYSGSTGTRTIVQSNSGGGSNHQMYPHTRIRAGSDVIVPGPASAAGSNFSGFDFTGFSGNISLPVAFVYSYSGNVIFSPTMKMTPSQRSIWIYGDPSQRSNLMYFDTKNVPLSGNWTYDGSYGGNLILANNVIMLSNVAYTISFYGDVSGNICFNSNGYIISGSRVNLYGGNYSNSNIIIGDPAYKDSSARYDTDNVILTTSGGIFNTSNIIFTYSGNGKATISNFEVPSTRVINAIIIQGPKTLSIDNSDAIGYSNNFVIKNLLFANARCNLFITSGNNYVIENFTSNVLSNIYFRPSTNVYIGNLLLQGSATNVITLSSNVPGTTFNLYKLDSNYSNLAYCNISGVFAGNASVWRALTKYGNQNLGNNYGILFSMPGGRLSNFF